MSEGVHHFVKHDLNFFRGAKHDELGFRCEQQLWGIDTSAR